jgi:hypothetical protein
MSERILPLAVAAVNGITLDPERIVTLLESSPGHKDHAACGLKQQPCSDCQRTAPLQCFDEGTCGVDSFCRPCAAYWRLRMWEGRTLAERLQSNGKKDDGFAMPVVCSKLEAGDDNKHWLLHGYLARGETTLFSALWKAGKTTWLLHLLLALQHGRKFCGLTTCASKVLYVTEETQTRWAKRRDKFNLGDHVYFQVRPFKRKPGGGDWLKFIDHLVKVQEAIQPDLIVMDTISSMWPIRDENDAAQVQQALLPLHQLTDNDRAGLALVHHLRKGDGQEATGSRGSGALPSFVDTILELRRFDATDHHERRRVLTGYGRSDETPAELVVELAADGSGYSALGDRQDVARARATDAIFAILPTTDPGKSYKEIQEDLEQPKPRKTTIMAVLDRGISDGDIDKSGRGISGDPYRYRAKPRF